MMIMIMAIMIMMMDIIAQPTMVISIHLCVGLIELLHFEAMMKVL